MLNYQTFKITQGRATLKQAGFFFYLYRTHLFVTSAERFGGDGKHFENVTVRKRQRRDNHG